MENFSSIRFLFSRCSFFFSISINWRVIVLPFISIKTGVFYLWVRENRKTTLVWNAKQLYFLHNNVVFTSGTRWEPDIDMLVYICAVHTRTSNAHRPSEQICRITKFNILAIRMVVLRERKKKQFHKKCIVSLCFLRSIFFPTFFFVSIFTIKMDWIAGY